MSQRSHPAFTNGLPPGTPAILMRQVVKTFHNAAGEFKVLKNIDLTLRQGEFVAIVGKSGSGKSTLLNMITAIDRPTSGDVIVAGVDIHHLGESQRALWRGRNVGIVFQFFQLLPTLSLLENVMLPMDYCKVYAPEERPVRALELLEMVGLEEQAHKLPGAVSTGQQQSAAIARALATDPPIIVADEPTGNLDTRSADRIISLFDRLVSQGKTIAMVTHDPSLTSRTDRTIVITDGELVNETVVDALPLLSHRQMLHITKRLERLEVPAGGQILRAGEHFAFLYLIEKGQVEIVLQSNECPETVVAALGRADYFGEIELISGGAALADVRAGPEGPASLLTLPHQDFVQMLRESPMTEDALSKVVQARIEQHRQFKGGCA
jgi:ABC-type lipoprotein export system ATPase subunit